MDNSAYVPSSGHLNSPALVVFSQAAGGLQDALRIQRPFNPQFAMSEASKELHRPFTSSFGLRHMEAYSGLPAHILNHLQPQFLHPGLSLGSGAFRPLADLKAFPSPSAFAPPKCLKIETNSETVHHGHGIFSPSEERFLGPSPRTDSCSPASASMSPQPQTTVKEESLDAHMSEDGDAAHGQATDNDSPGIHEENRGFRNDLRHTFRKVHDPKIGPLFGGGFSGSSGAYTFSVPGLPPAAHALAKTSFLFDHEPFRTPRHVENNGSDGKTYPTELINNFGTASYYIESAVNNNSRLPLHQPQSVEYNFNGTHYFHPESRVISGGRSFVIANSLDRIPHHAEPVLPEISPASGAIRRVRPILITQPPAEPIVNVSFPPAPEDLRYLELATSILNQEQFLRSFSTSNLASLMEEIKKRETIQQVLSNILTALSLNPSVDDKAYPLCTYEEVAYTQKIVLLLTSNLDLIMKLFPYLLNTAVDMTIRQRHLVVSLLKARLPSDHLNTIPPNEVLINQLVHKIVGITLSFLRTPQYSQNVDRVREQDGILQGSEPFEHTFVTQPPIARPVRIQEPQVAPKNEKTESVLTWDRFPDFKIDLPFGKCSVPSNVPKGIIKNGVLVQPSTKIPKSQLTFYTHSIPKKKNKKSAKAKSKPAPEPVPAPQLTVTKQPFMSIVPVEGGKMKCNLPVLLFKEPKCEKRKATKKVSVKIRAVKQKKDIALNKKKRDPSCCPICGMTISPGDLEAHLGQELEVLCKISGTGLAATRKRRQEPGRPPALPGDSGPEGRWETFQRIKSNRQGRLRLKTRKRKADDACMLCVGRLHRTPEELNMHGEQCRKNSINDEDETVDVEGDSELEEWAENQRRSSSMGNVASGSTIGSSTGRISSEADNEGDDVIVDGDEPEESSFGPSQYTENDVVVKNTQEKNAKKEGVQSQVATVNSSGDVEVTMDIIVESDSNVSTSDAEPSSRTQMLEELRNRIRPLTAESGGETATSTETEDYKCLICLEHYKKPVISTVCWHVHCEDCWLHALGSKNICPQCSMITNPTDLRRIFM